MPTSGIWALDWLNANAQRKLPLSDDASGKDVSGTFNLPNDFLVELQLPISVANDVRPNRFMIYRIGAYAGGYSLFVGYQPEGTAAPVVVASALIPKAGHTPNSVYTLNGVGNFADSLGHVVIGRLENIDAQPGGLFSFNLAGARLDVDCIRPMLRSLGSLTLVSGTSRSAPLYGDIELIAGTNIELTAATVAGQNRITISAVDQTGLTETCECVGSDPGPCIRRINGIRPTPAGDFTLLGDDCLKINGISNGLSLQDICSKPCCGCVELEAITRDLELFGSKAATLENALTRMEASVTSMDRTVLGSKLGDGCGCTPCAGG